MTPLHNTTLRAARRDSAPTMVKPDMSRFHGPAAAATANKAGTFGPLSACANRRVPSSPRAPRRSCTANIPSPCGGDGPRNPWSPKPRRPSFARVEHISRARARSVLVPTAPSAVPPSDLHPPSVLPKPSASPSVPAQILASPSPRPAPDPSCPFPVISTLDRPSSSESRRTSLTARARRAPSSSRYPPIDITASTTQYTFDVVLPTAIKPEMVTITTARGDKLKIVADAWHLEADCHFEWEIAFRPKDVNLAAIRAKFGVQGRLTISAGRIVCTN
ncbi:hypothetical protein B0H17DRAFT_1224401 [Mycena rosella]|uniref:SHSP domain-containing protein n=1 Tax=Mycena rosella TaxID=1033263 RepID=A0AAD7M798_MYCRO|nr:hypothetical protein B0H17DRAFT_1224401 [Mycena rosella]